MEDTEEDISGSLAIQQYNNRTQLSGGIMRSKQPTNCQRGGNYGSVSKEDSSEPTGKVADSKSKVNC